MRIDDFNVHAADAASPPAKGLTPKAKVDVEKVELKSSVPRQSGGKNITEKDSDKKRKQSSSPDDLPSNKRRKLYVSIHSF